MKIVLLGYMGAGKSSVGKLLAEVLAVPFIDLDAAIAQQEGLEVSEIFKTKGEIYFRKTEAAALHGLLSEKGKSVIALGGGTPCYGTVMNDLKETPHTHTVYLKTSVEVLTKRLWKDAGQRPLIAHLTSEELLNEFVRKHLFERGFYYNQAAILIDCDALSPREITEKIILRLL